MLDLDPRVHLHEEVVALAREQTFDRAGRAIPGRASRVDRDPADPLAQRVVDRGRGSLLDELLMAALDRAVALAEVDHIAVPVGQDLNLDVTGILDEPLDVDGRIGEVLLPLARRGLERTACVVGSVDELHSLPAPSRRRLDDQRVADLLAEHDDALDRSDRLDRARDDRDAGGAHRSAGSGLRPHQLDRGRRRPDPDQAGLLDEAGEPCVLGEEAVAGMNSSRPGAKRGLDEHVAAEVALRGRAWADEVRLVGGAHVRAPPVGLRVDGDAAEPELAQGAKDPDRDLAAVRDEHLRERCHGIGGHDARILPHE